MDGVGLPVAISYSGGTSSEWMIEAVIRGVVPRPSLLAVFFADTGEEHDWTYNHISEVRERCAAAGIDFIECRNPRHTLGQHILNATASAATGKTKRMDCPPLWIAKADGKAGKLPQTCTQEFKTRPIRRAISLWLKDIGAPKRVVSWIGYALDEQHRATKAVGKRDVQWERLDFPAIRYGRTRQMQRDELTSWTGRAPKFSMCVCCPFKTPGRWAATGQKDFARAVEIDEAIRNLDEFGITDGQAYLSDRLVPVARLRELGHLPDDGSAAVDDCGAGRCFL